MEALEACSFAVAAVFVLGRSVQEEEGEGIDTKGGVRGGVGGGVGGPVEWVSWGSWRSPVYGMEVEHRGGDGGFRL